MVHGQPDWFSIVRIKGVEGKAYRDFGVLKTGSANAVTVFDLINRHVTLEMLEVSFEHEDLNLRLWAYDMGGEAGDDVMIPYTMTGGAGLVLISPKSIRDYKSDLFELLVDVAGHYKIGLKKKVDFPNGVVMMLLNLTETNYYYAYQAIVSIKGWG